jgi:hypothetical protein
MKNNRCSFKTGLENAAIVTLADLGRSRDSAASKALEGISEPSDQPRR